MFHAHAFQLAVWLALGTAVLSAIARGFWLYRASLAWPTADGLITRIDIRASSGYRNRRRALFLRHV